MTQTLQAVVAQSPRLRAALDICSAFTGAKLYLAAGAVVQTVWNHHFGLPAEHGISDLDIVYCNPADLSAEAEDRIANELTGQLALLDWPVDVKNQARVHIWYHAKFGYPIPAVTSIDAALRLWPTTATATAIRSTTPDHLEVLAPFGLEDLFAGIVR